jgi:hypothetical protein
MASTKRASYPTCPCRAVPVDPVAADRYDYCVKPHTVVIASSPIHVESNDPKEARDANKYSHECIVEPDFGAWDAVRPMSLGKPSAAVARQE